MRTPETAFGQQLRHLRRRAGLSQEALAERAGLAPRAIAALESGARRSPYARTLGLLAEALGLSAAERAALADAAGSAACSRGQARTPAPHQPAVQTPQLPVWLTSFVGREAELDALRRLLDPGGSAVRLVTLLGPGGVGKTRLAVAVAAELAPVYPDRVVFVDLAPLRDARLVPATIARALDVRESGGRSARELLLDALRERHILLVLDNFEHLLGATPLVPELLQQCPRVAVLVTSRTALRVQGERRFAVGPLATPSAEADRAARDISGSPAVQLFVERAQAVVPEFALTELNASDVARLCGQLDGLPLAIELAAARAGVLSPGALVQRLERRLAHLTGGAADLPERQRTLRNTLAWSHGLLAPADQVLFRRLAVFAGGWTLEAAEAVCADAELPADAVLDQLRVLVDSSLVRRLDAARGEVRFGMLETIRDYALERLEAAGEAFLVGRRHLEWCLALAESMRPDAPDAQHLTRLAQEQDNLRAGLRWSIAAGEAQLALRLGVALFSLWFTRDLYAEGRAWFTELLAMPGAAAPTAARALALAYAGQLASLQDDVAAAEAWLHEGITTAEQAGDSLAQAICWHTLGNMAQARGALHEAEVLHHRTIALARRAGSPAVEAWGAYLLARVRYELGDVGGARLAVAETRHLGAADNDPRVRARLLALKGWLAALDGDARAALTLEQEGLALAHAIGDQYGLKFGHLLAARNALDRGKRQDAAKHLVTVLTIARDTSDHLVLARGLEGVAQLLAEAAPRQAVRFVGAAAALRERYGLKLTCQDRARLESWAAGARLRLGEAAHAVVWAGGQRDSLEHTITLALDMADATGTDAPAPATQV
jgi:predicted ATPase/DNA-binding XRE family transcriptional regulator